MAGELYDTIGQTYASFRAADPRIAARIVAALGDAALVVNMGAGTGSYEPSDRTVVAVEPSAVMIAQRPPGSAPVVQATAEALPFADNAFDAALASLTVHHWSNPEAGLAEMARVAPRRVVVGFEPAAVASFWLVRDYLPEAGDLVGRNMTTEWITSHVRGTVRVEHVPIPADCIDGFFTAYWNRPEEYLRPEVRASISVCNQLPPAIVTRAMTALAADLESGEWDSKHGHLRALPELELGHRIVVSEG